MGLNNWDTLFAGAKGNLKFKKSISKLVNMCGVKVSYQPGNADSSGGDNHGSTGSPDPLHDNLCGNCEK